MLKTTLAVLWLTLVILFLTLAQGKAATELSQCHKIAGTQLQTVGKTRVQVLFFKVYDAYLRTNTGHYPEYTSLQLELNYLRAIKAADLLKATADEWEKQGFPVTYQSEQWLQQLHALWPDVKTNDCLIAEHIKGHGVTFYTAEGLLGTVQNEQFADQFLAIWLSPESSFQRNRNELVGR
ncbi:chalcone isomerase family protein [Aliidiomarina quisquiliarum]|uniref:chalcone isomerase family protein n=1 Tax=Aliidiomarina quisquiliarum TaxID=2938947 RepID=UPI00208FAA2B|nr:chalcone isomerase family protein [Aliidiomarina quisquiliarum]MCO4320880.1 chalcone isomerase family protein [Aliidiomarina quisquiliarum]